MALIKCDECGKDVSNKAIACPYCGNPIAEKQSVVTKPVLIIREARFTGYPSKGHVFIDGKMIGTISNGTTIKSEQPIGTHNIIIETPIVHGIGAGNLLGGASSVAKEAKDFTISEDIEAVHIHVIMKFTGPMSWFSTATCLIDRIEYK